jgi:hypothetical protein
MENHSRKTHVVVTFLENLGGICSLNVRRVVKESALLVAASPLGPGTQVRNGIDKKPEMLGPLAKRDIALLIFKLTSPSPTVFRSLPSPRSSVPSFISFLPKRGIAVPILKLTSSSL